MSAGRRQMTLLLARNFSVMEVEDSVQIYIYVQQELTGPVWLQSLCFYLELHHQILLVLAKRNRREKLLFGYSDQNPDV